MAEGTKQVKPKTIGSRAEAVAIAKQISANVRKRAVQAENDRRVPAETIQELTESGLFNVVTPKMFGGSELGFATLFDVTVELSASCASTGWVYGVLAGHSWLVNLFPEQAQQEVLSDPTALTATIFRLGGTITEVEGGYKLVNGQGRFASGIDHSSWLIVGNAVKGADGSMEPHFFIIPTSEVTIVDDWNVQGMKATGSKSLTIAETFIPKHRAVRLGDMLSGTSPGASVHKGALYRMPFADVAPFSIIGSPLGASLGAVRVFTEGQQARLENASEIELADASVTLARLADAYAEIEAAIGLVRSTAERIDAVQDPKEVSLLDRTKIPRNWAFAAKTCRAAVNRLFEVAGGSQIYNDSELQRYWRDVNSGAQHFAFSWENSMTNSGRVMVGKEPKLFQVKGAVKK